MWFIFILGLFLPRLVIVLLYFFSSWFAGVFNHWVWILLGFIFLPYTLLWYTAVNHWYGGQWGVLQIAVMVIALILDLSSGKRGVSR